MAAGEGSESPVTISLDICSSFDEISSAALYNLLESSASAPQVTSDSVCVEERTVMLDSNRKGVLIKHIPTSIHSIESEQDLRRYSFDALKKLARSEKLNLEKSSSREHVVQALEQLRLSKFSEEAPQLV